jgi:hypothetical protein
VDECASWRSLSKIPLRLSAPENPYFTGLVFAVSGHFRRIFEDFGQFRFIFRADFSLFGTFPISPHGILANESRPCTTAHHRIVLKQDVRPHPLSNNFWEHQVAHFWHDFTLRRIGLVMGLPYSNRLVSAFLAGNFKDSPATSLCMRPRPLHHAAKVAPHTLTLRWGMWLKVAPHTLTLRWGMWLKVAPHTLTLRWGMWPSWGPFCGIALTEEVMTSKLM